MTKNTLGKALAIAILALIFLRTSAAAQGHFEMNPHTLVLRMNAILKTLGNYTARADVNRTPMHFRDTMNDATLGIKTSRMSPLMGGNPTIGTSCILKTSPDGTIIKEASIDTSSMNANWQEIILANATPDMVLIQALQAGRDLDENQKASGRIYKELFQKFTRHFQLTDSQSVVFRGVRYTLSVLANDPIPAVDFTASPLN